MEFERLLQLVGDEPVFESALLLAGEVEPANLRLQLSRWTSAGRLYQLRRGLYALAPPYQKTRPHPFLAANRLVRASYVSCQSALSFYSLIPETVPATVSVTAGRPTVYSTPLGVFEYRHVKAALLRGYRLADLGGGQRAFVATPEKALLDLLYLQPGGDSPAYLGELRLQNLERLDLDELRLWVEGTGFGDKPKLQRAREAIATLAQAEAREYRAL